MFFIKLLYKRCYLVFSAYDRLMATLDSVKFASYVFGQFGYVLAAFWVTYTGADSLMVLKLLGNI